MTNSFIINFFIAVYSSLKEFYKYSFINKLQNKASNKIKEIADKSFFVKYFTSNSNVSQVFENSKLHRFFVEISKVFSDITKKISNVFASSKIIPEMLWFFDNIFFVSIRCYGCFLICAVFVHLIISAIFTAITAKVLLICALTLVFGAILYLINLSPFAILKNSFLVKKLLFFFDVTPPNDNKTLYLPKINHLFFALLGVFTGVLTYFYNGLYAVLIVVAVFGALFVITNFKRGIYIGAVLFPFLPTMVLVGLILLSALGMILKAIFDENFKLVKTELDFPIFAFSLILLFSAVFSFTMANSIKIVLVYFAFISSYFLIVNTIKNKNQFYVLISCLIAAGFLVSLYGIYQYFFGFSEGLVWLDSDMFSDIQTRVVSTFENPNVLGEYLLLIIPLSVALIWSAPKNYNKFFHLLITGALMLCMIFTFSRGNWIGLLIAFFLFFAFYDRKFIWFGVILLFLSPLFLPDSVITRFLSVGDVKDTSTSYRVNIWHGTILMLKDYWFSGIGLGTEAFNTVYPFYSYAGVVAPHSHNLYLQIIAENGIIGIISFLSIIIIYYKQLISTIVKLEKSFLKALLVGFLCGMTGYLVQGLFDNVWYNYRIVLFFFLTIGLSVSAVNCAKIEGGFK